MPGTIHVSVLDFCDLPSTSSSSVLFKVSMGKREYQTLDKGDFSFPVKSLREKLILVVLDDAGSEMCQTVVEAILIVQKGQWEDYFSLDDRGRVRMRLQFVLSDEDRVKIRKMRESALQKKRSQLFITHPEFQRSISLDVDFRTRDVSVDILSHRNDGNEAAKATPVRNTVSFSDTQLSLQDGNKKGDTVKKERANLIDRERTEEAVTPLIVADAATVRSAEASNRALVQNQEADKQHLDKSPGAVNFKQSTFTSKGKLFIPKVDEEIGTTTNEGKLRKIPSSVRKMISAFEFNTTQDTKSRNKPPPVKSPINKLGFENNSNDYIADEVIVAAATEKLAEMSPEIVVSPSFFSELRQKVLAKKRQISYDVVEIVTVAPERGLAEASADEVVTEPPETESEMYVSAFDAVDRFEVTQAGMRKDDMFSSEDYTSTPTFEMGDEVDIEQTGLDNKGMQVSDDKRKLATVENDSIVRPEDDSNTKSYEIQQTQMRNLNDETETSTRAQYTLWASKDGSGFDNDEMSSTRQLFFDDMPSDSQNSENNISAEDTLSVTADASGPKNDHAATDYEDSAKQLLFDGSHSDRQNSGGRTIIVINENKPSSEDPQHVNKGMVPSKKLDNTNSSIEWSPTSEPPISWVFPDESRASCIAPSSIQLANSIGGSKIVANSDSFEHNMPNARKPCQERKPVDESAGDGNPKGQFAQAIKIAIMVAFGALVFFSRQRNHR